MVGVGVCVTVDEGILVGKVADGVRVIKVETGVSVGVVGVTGDGEGIRVVVVSTGVRGG